LEESVSFGHLNIAGSFVSEKDIKLALSCPSIHTLVTSSLPSSSLSFEDSTLEHLKIHPSTSKQGRDDNLAVLPEALNRSKISELNLSLLADRLSTAELHDLQLSCAINLKKNQSLKTLHLEQVSPSALCSGSLFLRSSEFFKHQF
jgi:hypothetical protein